MATQNQIYLLLPDEIERQVSKLSNVVLAWPFEQDWWMVQHENAKVPTSRVLKETSNKRNLLRPDFAAFDRHSVRSVDTPPPKDPFLRRWAAIQV